MKKKRFLLPEYGDGQAFRHSFPWRSYHDVLYHIAGLWNPVFYPGYRTHSPVIAPVEYVYYLKRMARTRGCEKSDAQLIDDLVNGKKLPYFVLPLQLDSDSQIKVHSSFSCMKEVVTTVLNSFALHAPEQTCLVVKIHPLDPGLLNYQQIVLAQAKALGLTDRIYFLETGNLHKLLQHAAGLVTVNSTAGGLALSLDCPTVCLSDPIYNLPGLTFQGALNDFWANPQRPDSALFSCFRNTVIHCTQVNGGFYCASGIALAVDNSAAVLAAEHSPLELLLNQFPPL